MPAQLNVGVIGLGVMGRRMLDRIRAHPRLNTALVWDANADAVAQVQALHPGLRVAAGAAELIAGAGLHSLYIATPPAAHMALSNAAFDAGLTVLCEKPLTVDFDAARRTIRRIADEKHLAAVNFSLASSHGLAVLQQMFGPASGHSLGALREVTISLEFAQWPRPWQAGAGAWLSQRAEGGFSREVLSHFIFVLQRVLGRATVEASLANYPVGGDDAETGLQARLRVAGVPITVSGRVDPSVTVADRNQMNWRASDGEIVLRDWFALTCQRRGEATQTLGESDAMRACGQTDQMDQWVALIEGGAHSLPDFAEALAVQETIEAVLAGR